MKKIFKIEMDSHIVIIDLPKGSRILHAGAPNGSDTSFWYEFNPAETVMESRTIRCFNTGAEVPDDMTYLNSFKTTGVLGNILIWHAYYK